MNLSLDQYIEGFERSAVMLPSIVARWSDFGFDLREAHASQLEWMLDARDEAMLLAFSQDRGPEIAERLARVSAALFVMLPALNETLGITVSEVMPRTISVQYMETSADVSPANDNTELAIAA